MTIRNSTLAAAATMTMLVGACSAQPSPPANSIPADRPAAAAGEAPAPVAAAEAVPPGNPTSGPAPAAARPEPPRSTDAAPSAAPPVGSDTPTAARVPTAAPEPRMVTIPAGTTLPIDLRTTVASDTSQVEDRVTGALRRAVSIRGVEVLPAGTVLSGRVTQAARSAKVKGRGRVAFRFTSIDLPGPSGQTTIRTSLVVRQAPNTKKQDAAKIGGGAAGGALLGAILGGGDGAAKGAAIGGAAGTGVVLNTRGKEVRLPAGTDLTVSLLAPITVRVR